MPNRSGFDFNLFRAMEVFSTVVETRHVTRAAEMLGMTQSAASQHLRSLEDALGTRLLDRSSRPIELTQAGISLHRRAARILNEIEDLKSDVRRLDSAPMPMLRIGILASIATTLTPTVVALARDRLSIPEVAIHAGLATDHQDLLRNRRADVVITSDALYDVDGLERTALMKEAFVLVTPQEFSGPVDDLAALARDLPMIRFSPDLPVGRWTDQHLRRVRLEIPRVFEADRSSMVAAMVSAGRGFAIMTPTLLLDAAVEGMGFATHPLPIAGFQRELTLVARSRELGELPALLAEAVTARLREAIGSVLPGVADRVRYAGVGDGAR